MSKLLEDFTPVVKEAGLNTLKSATFAGITVTSLTNTGTSIGSKTSVTSLTTTAAVTAAQSGGVFQLNPAAGAGFTTTLPAPAAGLRYTFIVATSVSSGTLKIITDAGATLLQGFITGATTTASGFESVIGSSNISVAMNGSTTGGLVGTHYEFICLSATLWQVFGVNFGSGSPATPFSAS